MRQILYPLVLVLTALGVGFGLSYYSLEQGRELTASHFGVWSGWPNLGTEQIDPYSKAHLAREGILALGKGEAVQFIATHDPLDRKLDGRCTYRLAGNMPNHSLWTLVARDANSKRAYAHIHSGQVQYENDGRTALFIAPRVQPGNWLNTDGLTELELVLTLYDTTAFTDLGSQDLSLPQLTEGDCI